MANAYRRFRPHLDLNQVRLLDANTDHVRLGVRQQTDDRSFLLEVIQLLHDCLSAVLVLSGVLLKRLLLGLRCPQG